VLRAAALRAGGKTIEADHLPDGLRADRRSVPHVPQPAARPLPLKGLIRDFQKRLIVFALRNARGNRAGAAKILEVSRSELWRRMGELSIGEDDWRTIPAPGPASDASPQNRGV
jgi:DNA-binding NtrC family response regulator